MSALDLRSLALELGSIAVGGHVGKARGQKGIFCLDLNLERETLPPELDVKGEGRWIRTSLINALGSYLYLDLKPPPGISASSFAMGLRKHISNARVKGFEQVGSDRILALDMETPNEGYRLYVECFGNGNIILMDSEENIIQALVQREWRHRRIKIGDRYTLPPRPYQSLLVKEKSFREEALRQERNIGSFLATSINLGGEYAEEVCTRAGADPEAEPGNIDLKKIYASYQDLLEESGSPKGYLYLEKGRVVSASPVKMSLYKGLECEEDRLFLLSLRRYFQLLDQKKTERVETPMLRKEKKIRERKSKLERIVRSQEKAIKELDRKSREYYRIGDMIYENYGLFDGLVSGDDEEGIKALVNEHDAELLDLDQGKRTVTIKLDDLKVTMDRTIDINANASRYYNRAGELKKKREGAQRAMKEKKKELKKGKVDVEEKRETTDIDAEQRWWFENYHWSLTPSGRVIAGGKDAKTNDTLVKKHMTHGDMYFHADIHGAPSVVMKACDMDGGPMEGEYGEEEIKAAATLALCYSKAWSSQIYNVSVYWVYPEQVSKTPESGEFLAKGAFIIRGRKNYVRDTEMKLSLGIKKIKGYKKLMITVPSLVKETDLLDQVDFVPGEMKKVEAAKAISKRLNVPVDPVNSILPSGKFKLLK